jgi:hypothetical protein
MMYETMEGFYDYVLSFYGPDGIYPMGATLELVKQSTSFYLKSLKVGAQEFCGDSIDREHIREIMITKYGLKMM